MYTTCRVGVLSSEISNHSKISPPPSLRSHLTSSPMGVLSGDYGTTALLFVDQNMKFYTYHWHKSGHNLYCQWVKLLSSGLAIIR